MPVAIAEEPPKRARVDDGAGEQVRAGLLALLDDRDRHLAEPLGDSGCSSSSWPRRIAQASPAGPAPTIEHADLDPLVAGIGRLGDELARRERRREVGRA